MSRPRQRVPRECPRCIRAADNDKAGFREAWGKEPEAMARLATWLKASLGRTHEQRMQDLGHMKPATVKCILALATIAAIETNVSFHEVHDDAEAERA